MFCSAAWKGHNRHTLEMIYNRPPCITNKWPINHAYWTPCYLPCGRLDTPPSPKGQQSSRELNVLQRNDAGGLWSTVRWLHVTRAESNQFLVQRVPGRCSAKSWAITARLLGTEKGCRFGQVFKWDTNGIMKLKSSQVDANSMFMNDSSQLEPDPAVM